MIDNITQKLDQYDALLMQGQGVAAFNLKLGMEKSVVPDERMLVNEIVRLTAENTELHKAYENIFVHFNILCDENRWIPVTERLPEQHKDVLVCGTEAIGNIKYLCAVKCLDVNVFRPLSAPSVNWTHWRPLPTPPEQEE